MHPIKNYRFYRSIGYPVHTALALTFWDLPIINRF